MIKSDMLQLITVTITVTLIALFCLSALMPPNLTQNVYATSTGIITYNASISWNPDGTNQTTHINWGTLQPAENRTVTLYIKPHQNNVKLALETGNYTPPEAEQYLTLTWNYNGSPLSNKQPTPIDLTLHVSPNIHNITDFTFDIIIHTT